MKSMPFQKQTLVYQTKNGSLELRSDGGRETIWATQVQIANIFGIDRTVVVKHVRNILKDKELSESSVCAKFAHTAADGKKYQVRYYNLDIILAVGYRTHSSQAITFRHWATSVLRSHIVEGFTINTSRIGKNYDDFMDAVHKVQALLPAGRKTDTNDVLELVKLFANTWFSLDAFDRDELLTKGKTKRRVALTAKKLSQALETLKQELIAKGEGTELFATPRAADALEGIVGNVMQMFGGQEVYPSLEEKAAHLLYFIIKNHPFVDGNKRSGAFAFVWFLRQVGLLKTDRLTPEALTALTLLIAQSDPKEKKKMVELVMLLIGG